MEDTIVVRGEIPMRGNFESTLAFRDLDPRFERFWLRSHRLSFGLWFFAAGMFAYIIETGVAKMDGFSLIGSITLVWLFGSAILMFVGLRKYQLARFKTKAGVGVLEIVEDGPMKVSFEAFLAEVVSQISQREPKNA